MNWNEKYLEESLKLHIGLELNLCFNLIHYQSKTYIKSKIYPELDLTEYSYLFSTNLYQFDTKYTKSYNYIICKLIDKVIEDNYANTLKNVYVDDMFTINVHKNCEVNYIKINNIYNNHIVFDLYVNNKRFISEYIDTLSLQHLLVSRQICKQNNIEAEYSIDYYIGYLESFYKNNFFNKYNIKTIDIDEIINKFKTTSLWDKYITNKSSEEKNIIEMYLPKIIHNNTKY